MARCKKCNEKFVPNKFLQKFCGSNIDCKTAEAMYNLELSKKLEQKKWNLKKELVRPLTHSKETKLELQSLINKLARLIDNKFEYFSCIDCQKDMGIHIDGGHYISVGSNATLRFNLHNIHAQKRGCNRDERQGSRNVGYYKGLINRYGKEYADFVDNGLQEKYKYLGLKNEEVYQTVKIVRGIIKNFDTYDFKDALHARDQLNIIIGIYDAR
jgi:hypothetical protein